MSEHSPLAWREIDRESISEGFVHLIRWRGQFERFAGGWSAVVEREIVLRGDAVAVLPIDLERDTLLLVRQFRAAAARQPGGPWQEEILAGLVEAGEALEGVARREANEEAGLTLDELVPITRYQPSPGASDETLHLFLAPTSLPEMGGVFGLMSENEDIQTTIEPVESVLARLDAGGFGNSMTIIALQWLALQRARGFWCAPRR